MIRADKGELFVVTVALWDEDTGQNASGRTVHYDIRDVSDNLLSPPQNGTIPESTVESGIYRKEFSINNSGGYICYASCNDFYSSTEEIIINEENIYEIAKQNRHYNISVEEVLRENSTPTASQVVRKVPLNTTDYIINKVKLDSDSDWSGPTVASGIVWAWYKSVVADLPYKMGPEF